MRQKLLTSQMHDLVELKFATMNGFVNWKLFAILFNNYFFFYLPHYLYHHFWVFLFSQFFFQACCARKYNKIIKLIQV